MLGVFAKIPDREPVKTRLQAVLDSAQAERFQLASLADVLETAARVTDTPWLFVSQGADNRERLGALLAIHGLDAAIWPRIHLAPQEGSDLGERMAHAFATMHASAAGIESEDGMLLLGSDSPTLPGAFVHRALAALTRADVVLGPAPDGGYWGIGLRRPVPELFAGIPWSTSTTRDATLERADALDLRATLGDAWSDVDRPEDLATLAAQVETLRRQGDRHTARHVERWLRSEGWLRQDASSREARR